MASLLSRLFGLHKKTIDPPFERPSYPISPLAKASFFPQPPAPETASVPQPVKNWCHPFKDKGDQLSQLTHMANATGGYFPIGRSGLFHGGVHFDSGTGVTPDKPVHCLADGEVVAYRVDTEFPTTRYFVNDITVNKPFSRNFVLVRHRLQPPKIQGSSDIPPSLTFYSLYMHLQEWAEYDNDFKIPRPAFWPESETLLVKPTVSDLRPGPPEQRGLNVFNKLRNGQVIDLLLPGTKVRVSGTGRKRRLENSLGPAERLSADGSLPGYISASLLKPIAGNEYQIVSSKKTVNVRPEPNTLKKPLFEQFTGSEITVSGEGDFRKLERIHQYVDFNELQAEQKPLALDQVVLLDKPVPIKAGDLIGHLGKYQDMGADQPEHRLHLEVFTGDQIDLFLEASRAWAQRLPAKANTWLKLAKGTPVVPHQANLTGAQLKIMSADSPVSAAGLLIPKKTLDELAPDRKIHVPANPAPTASNWYHLDGLLHDADNNPLDGWVREEVGVTPWLSPWSWEGYDIIFDYGRPKHAMAAYFSAINRFNDAQRERFRPLAEEDNKGPMKSRLYDIIDRDRNGHITAEELRAAMRLPAHAQAISQMIVRKESEWFYKTPKWDALDELLGHSGSTPHLNWVAEKQRIEEMSWWGEVAGKVGLSALGKAFHFHPIGLIANFLVKEECACGCCFGAKFTATRYGQQYGPVYWGKSKLADYKRWEYLVSSGAVTAAEQTTLIAMSENEGNLDALQSYDSEILTAGAMQKTINPQGAGELSQQVYEFKQEHPSLYRSLFADCGWEVKRENGKAFLYYNGVTGHELKVLLRDGFNQRAYESKVKLKSDPLAVFVHAITTDEYLTKQVTDFVRRLRLAVSLRPTGYYSRMISDYIRSSLGKALVLDHHVNRPGYVARDFGDAVRTFYDLYPGVPENPTDWGMNHAEYESVLLEIYGPSRRMTDAALRYQNLKNKL